MAVDSEIQALRALALSDAEIETALKDWLLDRMPKDSAKWRQILAREERKWCWRLFRRRYLSWLPKVRRDRAYILESYSANWRKRVFPSLAMSTEGNERTLADWRDDGLITRRGTMVRVHYLLLKKIFDLIQPQSLLEVGCGNGLNLFVLASHFDKTRFSGVDLTEAGIERAKSVQAESSLPAELRQFSPLPIADAEAFRRIDFAQGDALKLAFPDRSFDVAMTVTALEQMETIRAQALAELARVARRYVVMVEPFADFNRDPLRRNYVEAKDYFSLRADQLREHGLEPVFDYGAIPHKIHLGVGFIVARPIGR